MTGQTQKLQAAAARGRQLDQERERLAKAATLASAGIASDPERDLADETVVAWVVTSEIKVALDSGCFAFRAGTIIDDRPLVRSIVDAGAYERLQPLSAQQRLHVEGPAITSTPFIGDATNYRCPDPPAPAPLTTEQRVRALEAHVARLSL